MFPAKDFEVRMRSYNKAIVSGCATIKRVLVDIKVTSDINFIESMGCECVRNTFNY